MKRSGDTGGARARRRAVLMLLLLAATLALALAAANTGAMSIRFVETLAALAEGPSPTGQGTVAQAVLWKLRLPRVAMAVLGGAALGLAGAVMQGVLKNPLASPFTLGISSAAGFGAALAISVGVGLAGAGSALITLNAFVFSLLACGLVFLLARRRAFNPTTIVLAGIAVTYLFSSATAILQYVGDSEEVKAVVFWFLGSLEPSTWPKVGIVAAVFAVAAPLLYLGAWDLNALAAGDDVAASLGVRVARTRVGGMALAALLAAAVIGFVGTIGFVGLVGPHVARMLVGADHRFQMPAAALVGALMLLLGDLAARLVLPPHVLPVGVMTAIMGVPFFIGLLLKDRRDIW